MNGLPKIVIGLLLGVAASTAAFADTVLLKNGRKVQGIVTSAEDDPNVVLEIGSGTMILSPDEVGLITRSDENDQQKMRDQWGQRRIAAEAAFQQGLVQERVRPMEETHLKPVAPKQAILTTSDGHLFVDVALNDGQPMKFLLDTGAPNVTLSKRTGEELGFLSGNPKFQKTGIVQVAGHRIPCIYATLDKVEVEGFWARQVEAIVYTEEGDDWIYSQNILGMSYLENFHFQINSKKGLLTLSWQELES